MEDYEKLGVFYLGRPYHLAEKKAGEGLFLYDSKDLVTHAVCVGMTGSGKTGLCISVLEEAGMDGIPSIAIDPKGDLTNLLLTFPDLSAADFLPWVNQEDALKKGMSVEDYAAKQADTWRNGLASWGESGERIRRLRQSTSYAIYTPGSTAGIPVSILKSFAAPPPPVLEDEELLRERINTTATSLLGIIGIEADPIKSREHILISTLLDRAWREGRDVDIASLIQQIQTPPMNKVGVMDLESFYPSKDRFALALSLNNLLAAPGFSTWLEGEPLDISSILYTPEGRPRTAVFYIAHLSDSERMFFVSLLLNQVLGWMRTLSGTTSLRAIIYMDEIFGFFPPVANPPSKTPLLTLLKQARAYGVGLMLATQNPVDLDYKGLSNTGTWFIGRLQTERDKARVLEGLEGVAATNGVAWDRQGMEQTLAGLSNRIFLMNNVHDDAPLVFETRWAMSYLRGPLTRSQIKQLMDPVKAALAGPPAVELAQASLTPGVAPGAPAFPPAPPAAHPGPAGAAPAPVPPSPVAGTPAVAPPAAAPVPAAVPPAAPPPGPVAAPSPPTPAGAPGTRPVLPPRVPQYFVPVRPSRPAGQSLVYRPEVIGAGEVHFRSVKAGVNTIKNVVCRAAVTDGPVAIDWQSAAEADLDVKALGPSPVEPAVYDSLPSIAAKVESYSYWSKEFAAWLARSQQLELWKSPSTKESSAAGESERDFRIRLQQHFRERRDAQADQLRQKYAPKIATLEERVRRARATVEREKDQARNQKVQTALSFGATILGGFMGRKGTSGAKSTLGGISRASKESRDVGRAEDTAEALQERLKQLEADFKADMDKLSSSMDPQTEQLEQVRVSPARKDVSVKLLALGWMPYWRSPSGELTPAW